MNDPIDEDAHEFLFREFSHLGDKSHAAWLRQLIKDEMDAELISRDAARREEKRRARRTMIWGGVGIAVSLALSFIALGREVWSFLPL